MDTIEQHTFEDLLIRYLQNTATPEELSKLLELIREAEDKKLELIRLKSIYDSLRLKTEVRKYPIDKSWENIYARIHPIEIEKKNLHRPVTKVNLTTLVSIAATILLLIAISLQFFYNRATSAVSNEIEYTRFVTEKGHGRSTLFLPDGTKVILNAGTSIQYPVHFDQKERTVLLEGEGYFDVVKNPEKPFIVKLKDYDVKVLGTVFNVKDYSDMENSTTSLISGKVHLTSYTTNGDIKEETVLLPNETATIDKYTGTITTATSNNELQLAWVDGLYKFKDKPFSEIIKELENIYNVQIDVTDVKLLTSLYTGSFILENTLEEVLAPLGKYNKFQYRKEGRKIKIYTLK